MNQPIPTAKDILLKTLEGVPITMTQLLIIAALFQLCCPNPSQPIRLEDLRLAMEAIAEKYGVKGRVTIDATPINYKQQANAHKN